MDSPVIAIHAQIIQIGVPYHDLLNKIFSKGWPGAPGLNTYNITFRPKINCELMPNGEVLKYRPSNI